MAEIWTDIWDWLGIEDNRARIAIIITVLGFTGGFLRWLLGRF
ncbi:MAG TPA: hypothetical protein VLA52_06050 [Thermohalobaculum sp.]|nr:hypothetical protein [Thermohalobaculum sp.]